MPIEFRCSQCNQLLRVSDQSAGKSARCPKCQTTLKVPGETPGAAPQPAPQGNDPFADLNLGGSPFPNAPAPAAGGGFGGGAPPKPDPFAPAGLGAGGFGAAMMVTASFGMVAAARAVDKLVAGARRPSERTRG